MRLKISLQHSLFDLMINEQSISDILSISPYKDIRKGPLISSSPIPNKGSLLSGLSHEISFIERMRLVGSEFSCFGKKVIQEELQRLASFERR